MTISQPAVLGGLFIGVLSALPIVGWGNCCCCLWVVCGGILAAYLDQQRDPTPISVGRGAFTGFLAGIIGAAVWMVVAAAVGAILAPFERQLADEMIRTTADAPPEVRRMIEWINANAGFAVAVGFLGGSSAAQSSPRLVASSERPSSATTCHRLSAVRPSHHRFRRSRLAGPKNRTRPTLPTLGLAGPRRTLCRRRTLLRGAGQVLFCGPGVAVIL